MCRFVLYLGPPLTISSLVTEPDHSLINQSIHARERDEPLNGDGFGLAWYVPEIQSEPGLFRSVTPAWSNANLHRLAGVTRSRCILAHVRAATQGLQVSESNCHPFVRGRYAFMHNGDLGGFTHVRRAIVNAVSEIGYEQIQGSTDSEHVFALVHDELESEAALAAANGGGHDAPCARMSSALVRGVTRALGIVRAAGVQEPSYLNLALSDGTNAVACRFTTDAPEHADTLYLHTGRRYVCEGGVCRMIEPEAGEGAVIISSEPVSTDPGWSAIPVNHIVSIDGSGVRVDKWPAAVTA